MTLTFMHFLIVCPLIGIAGFIDSIAGGGGLISLPAYLISGLPVHTCIATNKMSSSMGTAVATAKYALSGYIDWHLAVFCAAASLAGAAMGANLAMLISDSTFRILMLIILPLTALYVLRKKNLFADENRITLPFVRTVLLSSAIAFALGLYDGFYGPGTGTFLILLLTRFAHMDLHRANGITKVINLSSNISSLVVYLLNAQVLLPLGLTAGLFSILGNYLGSRCFTSKGAAIARPVILLVLCVFFIRTVLEMAGVA
ncbi:MAG: TSUP family transporter [Clostridia bacterium]|nr:TSUP family transporter [Clostridia bacterium]